MSISSEITRLQTAKANLKTAIENQGVTVGDVTLDQYPTKVSAIQTGGFRCTNKMITFADTSTPLSSDFSYTYTFDGQLADCAFVLVSPNDGCMLKLKQVSSTTFTWDGMTVTPGEIIFKDLFDFNYDYHIGGTIELVASKTLHFSATDLDITLSISSSGVISVINPNSGDQVHGIWPIGVVFKGTDGTYDWDIFYPEYEIYD